MMLKQMCVVSLLHRPITMKHLEMGMLRIQTILVPRQLNQIRESNEAFA